MLNHLVFSQDYEKTTLLLFCNQSAKADCLEFGIWHSFLHGRHTVTGMLAASGQQFMDLSSAYRLFSQHRVDTSRFFDVVRSGVLQELGQQQTIVVHMDDTILKKTGRHIPGIIWRRDPLGPHFQTNLI